jgi:hypothetical protein
MVAREQAVGPLGGGQPHCGRFAGCVVQQHRLQLCGVCSSTSGWLPWCAAHTTPSANSTTKGIQRLLQCRAAAWRLGGQRCKQPSWQAHVILHGT